MDGRRSITELAATSRGSTAKRSARKVFFHLFADTEALQRPSFEVPHFFNSFIEDFLPPKMTFALSRLGVDTAERMSRQVCGSK